MDTNCFISCVGKRSPYRNVFDAFLDRKYTLCVSSDILLEYEEKFLEFWGSNVTTNLLGTLLSAPNTTLHNVFFNFLLVSGDADDNKFADAYVSAGADYLVSNDGQLLSLRKVPFPVIHVVTLQEFSAMLPHSR